MIKDEVDNSDEEFIKQKPIKKQKLEKDEIIREWSEDDENSTIFGINMMTKESPRQSKDNDWILTTPPLVKIEENDSVNTSNTSKQWNSSIFNSFQPKV